MQIRLPVYGGGRFSIGAPSRNDEESDEMQL